MSPLYVGIFGFIFLLMLFALRMPVAISMIVVGFAGFSYLSSISKGLYMVSFEAYSTFVNYYYGAAIMFIWMGYIAYHSGLSRDLYNALHALVGQIRGGIAIATVFACGAFGAICGSTLATTASMGAVALPEMDRLNYDKSLSTGTIAAGGILGTMIPPSIPAIVYGIYTEQSIEKIFLALIVPGLMLLGACVATIYFLTLYNPNLASIGPKTELKEKIKILFGSGTFEIIVIFIVVLGGLFAGWFTPTESGAVGAICVLLVSLIRRKIDKQSFLKSLFDATKNSAMVFFLVLGAEIFGTFMALSRLPAILSTWAGGLPVHPIIIMSLLLLFQIVLGCVMDGIAVGLLTLPIIFPIAVALGFDPIWLIPMLVLVAGLGMITPPVGLSAYIVYGINKNVPLTTIFKGIFPFVISIVITIIILISFPQITLFLPDLISK